MLRTVGRSAHQQSPLPSSNQWQLAHPLHLGTIHMSNKSQRVLWGSLGQQSPHLPNGAGRGSVLESNVTKLTTNVVLSGSLHVSKWAITITVRWGWGLGECLHLPARFWGRVINNGTNVFHQGGQWGWGLCVGTTRGKAWACPPKALGNKHKPTTLPNSWATRSSVCGVGVATHRTPTTQQGGKKKGSQNRELGANCPNGVMGHGKDTAGSLQTRKQK